MHLRGWKCQQCTELLLCNNTDTLLGGRQFFELWLDMTYVENDWVAWSKEMPGNERKLLRNSTLREEEKHKQAIYEGIFLEWVLLFGSQAYGDKNGRESGNRIEQQKDFSSGRLYSSRHNWWVRKGEEEFVGEEGETNSSSYWNIDVNLLYLTSETLMLWMKLCRGGHCRRIRNQKIYSLQQRKTFCVKRFLC